MGLISRVSSRTYSPPKMTSKKGKDKAAGDAEKSLAQMSTEFTNHAMESSENLLKLWTKFNDREMETRKLKNAELAKIKDVKVDPKKAKVLQNSWGMNRIEALTLLKQKNDDLDQCMLEMFQR